MKNLVFQSFRFKTPNILIEILEILGILIKILGYSFKMLRISKLCDIRIRSK